MAELGIRALEAQRNARGPAGEYAFIAAVTGAIKLGDRALATRLLDQGARAWLRPGQRAARCEPISDSDPWVRGGQRQMELRYCAGHARSVDVRGRPGPSRHQRRQALALIGEAVGEVGEEVLEVVELLGAGGEGRRAHELEALADARLQRERACRRESTGQCVACPIAGESGVSA